jgi:hypothetical protein
VEVVRGIEHGLSKSYTRTGLVMAGSVLVMLDGPDHFALDDHAVISRSPHYRLDPAVLCREAGGGMVRRKTERRRRQYQARARGGGGGKGGRHHDHVGATNHLPLSHLLDELLAHILILTLKSSVASQRL